MRAASVLFTALALTLVPGARVNAGAPPAPPLAEGPPPAPAHEWIEAPQPAPPPHPGKRHLGFGAGGIVLGLTGLGIAVLAESAIQERRNLCAQALEEAADPSSDPIDEFFDCHVSRVGNGIASFLTAFGLVGVVAAGAGAGLSFARAEVAARRAAGRPPRRGTPELAVGAVILAGGLAAIPSLALAGPSQVECAGDCIVERSRRLLIGLDLAAVGVAAGLGTLVAGLVLRDHRARGLQLSPLLGPPGLAGLSLRARF